MVSLDKFRQVKESKKIGHHLHQVKEKGQECYIWKFSGDKKLLAKVKMDLVQRNRKEFFIEADAGEKDNFGLVVGASSFLNFFIPSNGSMFRCDVKEVNKDGKILVKFPEMLAQLERRKNLRISTYHDHRINIRFMKSVTLPKLMNQFFSKSCFDLSGGGFSLLVSKTELKMFYPEDTIDGLEIGIGDRLIKTTAKIKSMNEMGPDNDSQLIYKVWKIAFKFEKMDKIDQEFLSKFVFENFREDQEAV